MASTFSPRFEAVLAEANRFARLMGAALDVVHAGEPDASKEERFRQAFRTLDLPEDTKILWGRGTTPVEAILSTVYEHEVDLLIAGALKHAGDSRNFAGSVSRDLLRSAPSDLLILTAPSVEAVGLGTIVVEVELGANDGTSVRHALDLGNRGGARQLMPVTVQTPFTRAQPSSAGELEAWLQSLVRDAGVFAGEVDCRVIQSNTGFKVCEFVEAMAANLLVVQAPFRDGARNVPSHMDWIFQVIPTNLWVVA